jgi:hypothetical protein
LTGAVGGRRSTPYRKVSQSLGQRAVIGLDPSLADDFAREGALLLAEDGLTVPLAAARRTADAMGHHAGSTRPRLAAAGARAHVYHRARQQADRQSGDRLADSLWPQTYC